MTLQLKRPRAKRKTVRGLQEQLIDQLVRQRPPVGSVLPSLSELVAQTGASHSSVRRALDGLEREGWVERRLGRGTFVGPRAALPVGPRTWLNKSSDSALRLGVIIFRMGDQRGDWYSQAVLQGLDEEAASRLVRVELYGTQGGDVQMLSHRLMTSRPEALACVLPTLADMAMVAEAQRLGIPVVGAGYRMAEFGVPSVCADDVGGAALAVRHLVEHGHRRIGYVQLALSRTYVFRRREGYVQGLMEAGLEPDERLTLWLPTGDAVYGSGGDLSAMVPTWTQCLRDYLQAQRPTAVVFGNGMVMEALAPLVESGEVCVPDELSVVTFDQTYEIYRRQLREHEPTVVAVPWEDFGRQMVRMAVEVGRGEAVSTPPQLPCRLVPGRSVARVDAG